MNSSNTILTSRRCKFGTTAVAIFAIAVLAFTANSQAAIAISDFDGGVDDFDGWTGLVCPNPGICSLGSTPLTLAHFTTGGNPNGYIDGVDPDSSTAARGLAPAKFLDALALGLTLSFDALITDPDGSGVFDSATAPLITIEFGATGSGATLVYGTSDFPVIDGPWKHYDVPITPDDPGWQFFLNSNPGGISDAELEDFELVLASGERLTFIMEWLKDDADADTGGLDNVHLVPVPAALPLLLSALFGVGFTARRRYRRT